MGAWKKTNRANRKRVVMAMAWEALGHYRGVMRFAREAGWALEHAGSFSAAHIVRARPDGIICQLHGDTPDLQAAVRHLRVPTVELSDYVPEMRVPRVMPDFALAGKWVADHFLERGFTRFINVGNTRDFSGKDNTLANGFAGRIVAAGHPVRRTNIEEVYWQGTVPGLPEAITPADSRLSGVLGMIALQIKHLPKPVAVFVPHFNLCMELMDACLDQDMHIPEEVAFAVAIEDKTMAELATIPLTSAVIDYEAQAYAAAGVLDRLLRGEKVPAGITLIPPRELVVHESSNTLATPELETALALRYILANLTHQDLSVTRVARATGMSVSVLHRRFRAQFNETVAGLIHRFRMEKCQQYLRTTELDFSEIARRCGYTDTRHLRRALQRATNQGPREFRQSLNPAGEADAAE